MGLLPHQQNVAGAQLTPDTYASAHGPIVMATRLHFAITMIYHGILPVLPLMHGVEPARRKAFLSADNSKQASITLGNAYASGVSMNRFEQLGLLGAAVSDANTRDGALALVRVALEHGLASDGDTQPLFAYNANWSTRVGFFVGYGSDDQRNDHHVHWGCHIKSAVLMALPGNTWGADTGFGGAIKLLICDAANPLRDHAYFAFLRHFDV